MTLLSFVRSARERQAATDLSRIAVKVVTVPLVRSRLRDFLYFAQSIWKGEAFLVCRDGSSMMAKAVEVLLSSNDYDVLHIDQLTMAQYAQMAHKKRVRVVLDEHNVVSDLVLRSAVGKDPVTKLLLRHEAGKLRCFERHACSASDLVLTVTDRDRGLLSHELGCNKPVVTVPIGLEVPESMPEWRPSGKTVITVATLYYPPNASGVEWFIRHVLPRVREVIPEVKFVAVGARPPRRLQVLAAKDPSVSLPGYVAQEKLNEMLQSSGVMIVPLLVGGGMRVKILNAFISGVPVVSTSVGMEGISGMVGNELEVADDPQQFAEAVICILRDHDRARRMAERARQFATNTYDWAVLSNKLHRAYEALKI